MKPTTRHFDQAVAAIVDAPFRPDGWTRAIELAVEATGSRSMNLIGFGGPAPLSFNMYVGPEQSIADHYLGMPELWGRGNWRVNTTERPMSIQHDAHYAAYRRDHETSFYDDAVEDLEMQFGCQSALVIEQGMFFGLAAARGRREGKCDLPMLARFEGLCHHLHRSIRAQMALDGEAADLMLGKVDTVGVAALMLDRHGRVCALSLEAERMLLAQDPLVMGAASLSLADRGESRHFRATLARLLAANDTAGPVLHQMRVGRNEQAPAGRFDLSIVRLPSREHGLGFEPHVAVTVRKAIAA